MRFKFLLKMYGTLDYKNLKKILKIKKNGKYDFFLSWMKNIIYIFEIFRHAFSGWHLVIYSEEVGNRCSLEFPTTKSFRYVGQPEKILKQPTHAKIPMKILSWVPKFGVPNLFKEIHRMGLYRLDQWLITCLRTNPGKINGFETFKLKVLMQ